jgi:hypothetical protein
MSCACTLLPGRSRIRRSRRRSPRSTRVSGRGRLRFRSATAWAMRTSRRRSVTGAVLAGAGLEQVALDALLGKLAAAGRLVKAGDNGW